MKRRSTPLVLAALLAAAGCSADKADLARFVAEVRARPAKAIEPIPKMAGYTPYQYSANTQRTPFAPSPHARAAAASGGPAPNPDRPSEPLEAFPLDALHMVGTITSDGVTYALVAAPDHIVHRVSRGDYIGQENGRVTAVNPASIALREIVPDGTGGYNRRFASIALAQ